MQQYLIVLLISLISISVSAQGIARVYGKIAKSNEAAITLAVDKIHLDEKFHVLESKLSKGSFEFTVDLERNRLAKLICGHSEFWVYLEPGQALEVNFENDGLQKPAFVGNMAANNAFFSDFNKEFKNDFDREKVKEMIMSKNIDETELEVYALRTKQMKFYTSSAHYSNLSEEFKTFIKNHIQFNYLAALVSHPIIRGNENTKEMQVNNIPAVMLEDIQLRPATHVKSLISEAYREFLYYYVVYFTSENHQFQKFTNHDESITKKIEYTQRNIRETPKIYIIGRLIAENGDKLNVETIKKSIGTLNLQEQNTKGLSKTMPYKSYLQNKWAKELNRKVVVAKSDKTKSEKGGKMDPADAPYQITNLDGKNITLDEFKGKVVYIDFWASWCGPCRQQFPHAKAMKAKLDKKQLKEIVFLYISIDNNQEAWKKAIDKYGIEGYHVWSRGGWGSTATKHFGVTSIPRYMIMDKKGNLVDRNAKRPSMPETLTDILNLL